jgi:methionyl aminopeptidase
MDDIIVKNTEQIDGIRKSCQVAVGILKKVKDYIVPGMKTKELNTLIDILMRRENAIPATLNYKGYPASCCISVNDTICHGVPNSRILKWGDVVKIDVTTIVDGYYGDTCYTWVVGQNSPESHRIVSAARACLWAGVQAVKPGKNLGSISRAVRLTADKYRCSVVHQFCGHGVGVKFHEAPNVIYDSVDPVFSDRIRQIKWASMVPGMIFTIEPMINLGVAKAIIDAADGWSAYTEDGKLSAQFEHTVLVTRTGCEVLTDWGDEKTLLPQLRLPEAIWESL